MTIRRIYQEPTESSRHLQFKKACLDYFTAYDKLMKRPSRKYAKEARAALRRVKQSARHRGEELLSLYSDFKNIGKEPLYGNHDKFSKSLNRKVIQGQTNKKEGSYARN